jgi:sarcosine oxidase
VKVVVVGAGAWGLPAAAELARRGHGVDLLDAYGVGNGLSSSSGPTRIWRLAHPDVLRVRLARRAVDAWRRLESRTGQTILLTSGLLWRDPLNTEQVSAALAAAGVEHECVSPADVGRFLAGLRPDGVDAIWQPEAGSILAATAMAAHRRSLESAGGHLTSGEVVESVEPTASGIRLEVAAAPIVRAGPTTPSHRTGPHSTRPARVIEADAVVLAPGPWLRTLLPGIGVDIPFWPTLGQVTYLRPRTHPPGLSCWYEGPRGDAPGIYAMPTPGFGTPPSTAYKVGLDTPLRPFDPADGSRHPDPAVDALVARTVADRLESVLPEVLGSQACTWTMSPDGRFVIDRLHGGTMVLACGDSGEGFKFSALMGELLADLVEGASPDADVASFGLARFAGTDAGRTWHPPRLGR